MSYNFYKQILFVFCALGITNQSHAMMQQATNKNLLDKVATQVRKHKGAIVLVAGCAALYGIYHYSDVITNLLVNRTITHTSLDLIVPAEGITQLEIRNIVRNQAGVCGSVLLKKVDRNDFKIVFKRTVQQKEEYVNNIGVGCYEPGNKLVVTARRINENEFDGHAECAIEVEMPKNKKVELLGDLAHWGRQ